MIEVTELTRHYGEIRAVDNVSFQIGQNEIVGLLGHNGAGKTTIMRMLSGYLEPSAGQIELDGVNVTGQPEVIQQQLGYLPESLPVYPEMIVADYLYYVATLKGVDKEAQPQAVREALLATDLEKRALDHISSLSRGLKQRVGVAQAILGHPRLLILDEPTNGLDPGQTEHMRELIRRLARRATVILSTHILQEVDALCDRVLMLRNGQLALDEQLAALRQGLGLRLVLDKAAPELAASLARVPGVVKLEHPDNSQPREIVLRLSEQADREDVAAQVTEQVARSDARVVEIGPQEQDLDALFREVNDSAS